MLNASAATSAAVAADGAAPRLAGRAGARDAGDDRLPADLDPGDAPRGRLLIERYHCGACHAIPGVADARGTAAVPLDGFGRRSYIAGRVANEPDLLTRWIRRPASLVPDTVMPDMGASWRDARDMAAYLEQLR